MMTKKDFQALARALRQAEPVGQVSTPVWFQWYKDCTTIATVCSTANPRFNMPKFLEACGL